MKIALSSINPVNGDFEANSGKIQEKMALAGEEGCDLLILPELALSGSPPLNLLNRPSFLEEHDHALATLLAESRDTAVLCGVIGRDSSKQNETLYNSAVLFEKGKVLFVIHKHYMERQGCLRETDCFEAGEVFPPVPFRELRLGISLGREILPENTGRRGKNKHNPIAEFQKNSGADLFINLAAIPFNRGRMDSSPVCLAEICRSYGTPLLHVNQLGGQDSRVYDGRCLALNEKGEINQFLPPFEEGMLVIDTDKLHREGQSPAQHTPGPEEILRALVTGIRDFVRNTGHSGVIIGLSGGIDSALTCTLAARALGPENVLGVSLPSEITSRQSVDDARQLAENLGIAFEVIPIGDCLQAMQDALAPSFKDCTEDVTEANLQARIRANLLMAMANKFRRLLLATGNKSEVFTGYCTLYGDTCGALAPLADVPKTMVYELAALCNAKHGSGKRDLIPESIITRAPSAELVTGQKDSDDLPPYDVLDAILDCRLRAGFSAAEIISRGHDPEVVRDVLNRIGKYAYKRHQLPPGLLITSPEVSVGTAEPLTAHYQEGI